MKELKNFEAMKSKEHHSHLSHNEHYQEHHSHHDHGNPFVMPFILIALFGFVEFGGGILTNSLALLGDAWHMLTDAMALGLAMFARYRANQARMQEQKSHAELVASSINAVVMLIVIFWIVWEAIERFQQPVAVSSGYVMLVAFIGLVINLVIAIRLHHLHHHHGGDASLNQRAALLHVMGDLLGSVAALGSGIVIYFTGWLPIDPLLSLFISLLLFLVTLNLIKDIWHILKGAHAIKSHHE